VGAIAAFKGGWFDRGGFLASLFLSSIPPYCLAIILLFVFAVTLGMFPVGGAYSFGLSPEFSLAFFGDAITYFWLPFWSIVIISIGGQAVGMRSMSIYELNADYVKYARFLGIKDKKIVRYVFRNAMLPQVTGLAMSIGAMVGGALVAETIFSYPGLGMSMYAAINSSDYPVISACTLIITVMVLIASFLLDIIYAFIDPRVKAAQFD
jgi:peptide/nickel transport system permease protein